MEIDNSIQSEFFELIEMTFADQLSLERNSQTMAQKILSRTSTLVALVEALGPKLTSTSVQDRLKATEVLANVFSHLPKNFLTAMELEFIEEFLINRLKDQHLVVPKAILCIHPIVQCINLPRGAGTRLLRAIFQEANVQSHIHKIRRTVFEIVEFMLRTKLDELKELSTDFIVNFLQAIDGEKDPRNLLLLFQIIPIVISNFDLGPFIEDFFEVLAVYFPIDFNPTFTLPGADVITRESLVGALHSCLSHTNQFAEFLIPLTLEKLDSSLTDAKVDSLSLLTMCLEKCYQPYNLQPYLPQIWHSLRREIFMGGNETVENHSVDFLRSAFKIVSRDEGVLSTCIDMVFTECKHHLCEPELRLIHPTSRILIAMCDASKVSCAAVVPQVLPVLQEQVTRNMSVGEKKRILGIMELVVVAVRQYSDLNLLELVPNWDEILATWFSFLSNGNMEYVDQSLKILLRTLDNVTDFNLKHRNLLQEHVLALLGNSSLPDGTLATLTSVAEKITILYGNEFLETSVPKLLSADSTAGEKNDDSKKEQLRYKVLAECSIHDVPVCEKVVFHLLTKINTNAINISALTCLNRIVEKVGESQGSSTKVLNLVCLLVEKLLVLERMFEVASDLAKKCPNVGLQNAEENMKQLSVNENRKSELVAETESNTNRDSKIFNVAIIIIRNLMRGCEERLQIILVEKFWKSQVNEVALERFFTDVPLVLVESILGPLRPTVEVHRFNELVDFLLENGVTGCGNGNATASVEPERNNEVEKRLIAVFLNKLEPESEFLKLVERVEVKIDTSLMASHQPVLSSVGNEMDVSLSDGMTITLLEANGRKLPDEIDPTLSSGLIDKQCATELPATESYDVKRRNVMENATRLLAWVTKALAMRGIKRLDNWMEKLIKLLGNENVGKVAADGFNILLTDDAVSLNPKSHCKFRFLYKQRLFQMSVPKLVVGYREAKSETGKINFIQALSSQLKHIPKEILGMEMESVFPLLVASLKFNSSSAIGIISTLNAFLEMMNNWDSETEKRLSEYFHDIVPQLVRLAGFGESMEVRRLSLKVLEDCCRCQPHVIQPLRERVVTELQNCLDDPKRLVRRQACRTRNRWILFSPSTSS